MKTWTEQTTFLMRNNYVAVLLAVANAHTHTQIIWISENNIQQ